MGINKRVSLYKYFIVGHALFFSAPVSEKTSRSGFQCIINLILLEEFYTLEPFATANWLYLQHQCYLSENIMPFYLHPFLNK